MSDRAKVINNHREIAGLIKRDTCANYDEVMAGLSRTDDYLMCEFYKEWGLWPVGRGFISRPAEFGPIIAVIHEDIRCEVAFNALDLRVQHFYLERKLMVGSEFSNSIWYVQGINANLSGYDLGSCTHFAGSQARNDWQDGWNFAKNNFSHQHQ